MQERRLLIVSNGLIGADGSYVPHPELHPWRQQIDAASSGWFRFSRKMPLEWYALLTGATPASLACRLFPAELISAYAQIWIASPFHAQLMRDRLQVLPDSLFPWHEEDSRWLCDQLNPLLAEEGMRLVHSQECMALLCSQPIEAIPCSMAAISGQSLPNRHPEGKDGGRLMRLLSEIQMQLRQHPSVQRRQRDEPDVDGLWLWGAGIVESQQTGVALSVASRNPWLNQLSDGRMAEVVIAEAEDFGSLCRAGAPLPAPLLLVGESHAVLLSRRWLPRFGRPDWIPAREQSGEELLRQLQRRLHAA